MAVITLKRGAQTVGFEQRAVPQIFIAHSLISEKMVEKITTTLKQAQVNPLFAEQLQNQPLYVIIQALFQSDAMFMIITKKALQRKTIRDWILFELGLARARWRPRVRGEISQIPVFMWREITLRLSKEQPLGLVSEIKLVQMNSKRSRETMLREMQIIAMNLSSRSFQL
jgi:hypothetical protein